MPFSLLIPGYSYHIARLSENVVMPVLEGRVTLCPHISIPNSHTILLVTQGRAIERLC